jgi:guanylate kinase
MNKKRGHIFVITGPSGVGKTEITKNILRNKKLHTKRVVTCTTRTPRPGEVGGKDYFFLTKEEFLNNIQKNKMFEHAQVYGNYYGSRKEDVEKLLASGNNVIFTIDVQGAVNLKKIDKNCKIIFIKAESTEELKKRLIGRKTDSKEVIDKRIKVALSELKMAGNFDHVVINPNNRIHEAIAEVADIILGKINRIFLIEDLPGTGKSSVMEKLRKRHTIVYEFHTKRKKITKQFGAFSKGKRITIGNKKVKILEDKLEKIILNSRFISSNNSRLKLDLLKEKINECLDLRGKQVFKEGFFGCLIDENKKDFLEELKLILKDIDIIFFLKISDEELRKRQIKRFGARKGEYDDTTSRSRKKNFMEQFREVTKGKKVIYINATPSAEIIAKKIEKYI